MNPRAHGERDLFDNEVGLPNPRKRILHEDYFIAPLSVLDARTERWKARKREWYAAGLPRETLGSKVYGAWAEGPSDAQHWRGRKDPGQSSFDPVLAEVLCRWFSEEGGQVVDPFAGGPSRGFVSTALGRRYWGADLSSKLVELNARIVPAAEYLNGAAPDVLALAPPSDLILACPPYGNLEVYSEDPRDLSAMTPKQFRVAYRACIQGCAAKMKAGSFACFVVGEYRLADGALAGLLSLTTSSFQDSGVAYFNDLVLLTPVGTGALRARNSFDSSRKVVRCHQHVLVFHKI